jgi:hypothetical protein
MLAALQLHATDELRDMLLDGGLQCVDVLVSEARLKHGPAAQRHAAPRIARTTICYLHQSNLDL